MTDSLLPRLSERSLRSDTFVLVSVCFKRYQWFTYDEPTKQSSIERSDNEFVIFSEFYIRLLLNNKFI